jgi:hypothetical protein
MKKGKGGMEEGDVKGQAWLAFTSPTGLVFVGSVLVTPSLARVVF